MSSVLVLPQSRSVHMMTDGVAYTAEGVIVMANMAKANPLPTLNAAISCTGPASFRPMLADAIAVTFSSFDELIADGNEWLVRTFNEMANDRRAGDAAASLYLIGWHNDGDRPAAYAVDLMTDGQDRLRVLGHSPNANEAIPNLGKFIEQTTIAGTPLPGEDLQEAGHFRLQRNDDYDPEVDLLHLMEIQRHEEIQGAHWVGGKALLTSIDRKGITQRVVHHWPEDVVGEPITPQPINWKTWRADRNSASVVIPEGLSRLQRERMMKKAKKGTLRAV